MSKTPHASILVFPGTNREHDVALALRTAGFKTQFIWHAETALPKTDLIVLPGGFSYGDYLRTGAIATLSNVMMPVREAAARGVRVLGVCNGFQSLCEAGLLPGVLLRNAHMKFNCKFTPLRAENNNTDFTKRYRAGETFDCPIAHGEGNYTADADTIKKLTDENRIVFRYAENPNGSMNDIAGICSADGKIMGMMPHPENAINDLHGEQAGLKLFQSLYEAVA
jgi:phosphoribosylformylglycinamidine synthase